MRFGDGSVGVITYLTGGNARFPKETLDVAGGGRSARLDNFRGPRSGPGDGHDTITRALGGQDKGQRAELERVRRGLPDRRGRCRSRCDVAGRHDRATIAVTDSLASGGRSGCERAAIVTSSAGTSAGARQMSAGRDALAGPRPGGQRGLGAAAGAPGQAVRPRPLRRAGGERRFAALLPAGRPRRVPAEASEAVLAGGRPAARRASGRCSAWPATDLRRPGLVPRPGDRPAVRPPDTLRVPRSTTATEAEVGNVKQVWELSRHHHLTVLAAAWCLTGTSATPSAVADQLRSWWQAEPVPVRRALDQRHRARHPADQPGPGSGGCSTTGRGSADLFERNDAALCSRSTGTSSTWPRFRSRGSSANNHVIAEAAGQLVAGCAFPLVRQQPTVARAGGAALLERELVRNTFPSGLNRELASDYHGFVARARRWSAAVEADAAGHPLSDGGLGSGWPRWSTRLAALVDERLRPPRQGDGDEGRALLVDDPERRPLGRRCWPPARRCSAPGVVAACRRRRARRILARRAGRAARTGARPARAAAVALRRRRADPAARRRRAGGRRSGAGATAARTGFLSIAAHAHADALSVEVRHGGVDMLADPGTYCYHGEPEWRAYFRSTIAHNTLELGRAEPVHRGRAVPVATARQDPAARRTPTPARSPGGRPSTTVTPSRARGPRTAARSGWTGSSTSWRSPTSSTGRCRCGWPSTSALRWRRSWTGPRPSCPGRGRTPRARRGSRCRPWTGGCIGEKPTRYWAGTHPASDGEFRLSRCWAPESRHREHHSSPRLNL